MYPFVIPFWSSVTLNHLLSLGRVYKVYFLLYAACFPLLTSSETEILKEDSLSLEKEVKEILKKNLTYRGRNNHIFMLVFRETEHRKWVGGDNQEVRGEMSECDGEIMGASKCGSHFSTQRI